MKGKTVISIILPPVVFTLGYFFGAWLHPKFASHNTPKGAPIVSTLFGNDVCDMNNGTPFGFDTLAAHEKNLLVFWSPSCKFCRQFFQNRLNQEMMGIFCFPLTDDYEYVDFFVKQHEIKYPQLVKQTTDGIRSIDAPFVESIPLFLVVDAYGKILREHVGIDHLDELISTLY